MAVLYGKNYGEPTLDLNFAGNKSLVDTTTEKNYVTFSRAQSGNEATYIGSDGLIKYAAADEARFDHDPATGESLGLLIEEARTNLLQYSEDFTATGWNAGSFTNSNAPLITAPDGSSNTTLMVPTGSGNYVELTYPTGFLGVRAHTIFAKAGGRNYVNLGIRLTGGAAPLNVQYDLTTGQQTVTSTVITSTAQSLPNGWWKITAVIDGSTNANFCVGSADAGIVSTTPDGEGIYIWGAQAEAASFPTSYIPTSGGTATRAADVASISGTNFTSWFNQSAGTFVGTVGSRGRLLLSSVSTGPNVYQDTTYLFYSNSEDYGGSFNLRYEDRSQVLLNYMNAGWTSSIPMQNYAGAYSAEGVAGAWEGNLGSPQTPLSKPLQDDLSHMWIGRSHGFSDSRVQHIARLTYYPKRLPDIELQQLTK